MPKTNDHSMCFEVLNKEDSTIELLVYDYIGKSWDGDAVNAKDVAKFLSQNKDAKTINVRINSGGGSVSHGMGIYNSLNRHAANVVVDIEGMALSAASFIAMAGDEINMCENGLMMIHDPSAMAFGNAKDMEKAAKFLAKSKQTIVDTYAARTGKDKDEIAQMMEDETWFDAQEAMDEGFINSITEAKRVAACFIDDKYRNQPDRLDDIFNHSHDKPVAKKESDIMPEPTKNVAASYQEITDNCRGLNPNNKPEDAQFICDQMKASATLEQVQNTWQETLVCRIETSNKATDEATAKNAELEVAAKKAADTSNTTKVGVEAVGNGDDSSQDGSVSATEQFNDLVDAQVKLGKQPHIAMQNVCRKNPELRQAWVEESNAV